MSIKKIKRKNSILHYISINKHALASELCEAFNASEATIRRDLEDLAVEGLIERTHGGAKIIQDSTVAQYLRNSNDQYMSEKLSIAKSASTLIQDGETIFLGSGTTISAMIPHLKQLRNLTVITNALQVINELLPCAEINLVVIGGILRKEDLSMVGHLAEKSMNELHVDKVFVGTEAIDIQAGLTNSDLTKTKTDRAILSLSQQVVLVTDYSKFGKIKTSFWAPLTDLKTIITDWHIPQDELDSYQQLGIQIVACQKEM